MTTHGTTSTTSPAAKGAIAGLMLALAAAVVAIMYLAGSGSGATTVGANTSPVSGPQGEPAPAVFENSPNAAGEAAPAVSLVTDVDPAVAVAATETAPATLAEADAAAPAAPADADNTDTGDTHDTGNTDDTDPGDTDDTDPGNTDTGNTDTGNTDTGNTDDTGDTDDTDPGNTEDTDPGDAGPVGCPAGRFEYAGFCVTTCPAETLLTIEGTCEFFECPENHDFIDETCELACPDFSFEVDGQCIPAVVDCNAGYYWDGTTCLPVECLEGQTRVGALCLFLDFELIPGLIDPDFFEPVVPEPFDPSLSIGLHDLQKELLSP